jgi:hypothetical protein
MTYKKIVNNIFAKKLKTGWVLPILRGKIEADEEIDFMINLAEKVICNKNGESLDWDDVDFEDEFPEIQEFILNRIKSMSTKKKH